MKVTLEYDPSTGQISDKNNTIICYWMDLKYYEDEEEIISHRDVTDKVSVLHAQGVSIEDIIKLKEGGLL